MASKCEACGQAVGVRGYRKVTYMEARKMARAAGLKADDLRYCYFREGMAQHAAKLLISIALKRRGSKSEPKTK